MKTMIGAAVCALMMLSAGAPALAQDADGDSYTFTITNSSESSIITFHLASESDTSWSEDLIPDRIIEAGEIVPQTAAELRQNSERLHRFADVSSVEGFLEELAEREKPFAIKLPRAPGAREARWAHLLSGPVASVEHAVAAALPRDEEVALLRAEVASLRSLVTRIAAELGITS